MTSRSYLLICQKCPARLERKYGLKNPEFLSDEQLRSLRKEMKNSAEGMSIRAIYTECLGKCPAGKVCVLPVLDNKEEDFLDQESGMSGADWKDFIKEKQC